MSFIQLQYLKQRHNILWCFCGLKYENSLFGKKLFGCIVCSKAIAYITEKAQVTYFVQNKLVKITLLSHRNGAWLCCYCHHFCSLNFCSLFHGTCSNLTTYLFLLKNIKVFQWLLKWKLLSFMTKVNLNNGNETKSDVFLWDIFKSDIILHGRNILKYLNDFYHWPFSISLQKWAQTIKVK